MNEIAEDYITQEEALGAHYYAPLPIVLHKAKGVWVEDTEGNLYLDFMSAYSALSLGHSHPRIVAAIQDQLQTLAMCSRAFYHDQLLPFYEKLTELTGLDKVLPANTGVEAVEAAIKAARRYGYKVKKIPPNQAEIIVAKNNFHGRTTGVISFSSSDLYKEDFGPLMPGFVTVPFGDAAALEAAITSRTCAFLVEPIQGEAGIIVPPEGYLKAVRAICDKHGIALIFDEIQTGLGRTGEWFACQHEDVVPDGIILGKALGGGILPVSALVGTHALMDVFTLGSHGSTFGGNPLAMRVACESLAVIEEEGLVARSKVLGKILASELNNIDSPFIQEVRGKGLLVALELGDTGLTGREFCMELLKVGILTKNVHGNIIRLAPPLVIQEEDLYNTVEKIAQTLKKLESRRS